MSFRSLSHLLRSRLKWIPFRLNPHEAYSALDVLTGAGEYARESRLTMADAAENMRAAMAYMQSVYGSSMQMRLITGSAGSSGPASISGGAGYSSGSNGLGPAGGGGGGASSFTPGGGGSGVYVPGGNGGGGSGGNFGCGCSLCAPRYQAGPVMSGGAGFGGGPFVAAHAPTPGMEGFGEHGEEDFAAGKITGYRWWCLPVPDFRRSPLDADANWGRSLLSGQCADWQPGVNEAVCQAGPGAHAEKIPAAVCGCGYWGYWDSAYYNLGSRSGGRTMPVSGVIEGWGRTRVGELGFRSTKARILALHLPFTICATAISPGGWYDPFALSIPHEELTLADADRLEAWMAVIETRLEETYPGVKVFTNVNAMLARFPLTVGYGR